MTEITSEASPLKPIVAHFREPKEPKPLGKRKPQPPKVTVAVEQGMMVLYDASPTERIQTAYGTVSGREWLQSECLRIGNQHNRIARVEGNSLIVNRVAEDK